MLKLTANQLRAAADRAYRISRLEAAKDRLRSWTVPFDVNDDPRGYSTIDVEVPTEPVRQELNTRIKAAHAELAAMGIELAPGEDVSDD